VSAAPSLGELAGHWVLDPARSSVALAHKTMWGLVPVKGSFDTVSGSGEVDADGSVTGTLAVDAASVNTKHKGRDKHLRSADFFDVEHHPAITYTVRGGELGPEGAVTVHGSLEVAGQSRPLTVTGTLGDVSADATVLSAEVVIDRAEFGMTWNKMGMIKGPATLSITAAFTKAT
jgi:polyisoprenoid-binding protein YceI